MNEIKNNCEKCIYKRKNELKQAKDDFFIMLQKVRKEIKKSGIVFDFQMIGSGKRNMVIKLCNKNTYDLDYQLILTQNKQNLSAYDIKKKIKDAFTNDKLQKFGKVEDSTQAITIKPGTCEYGYDIIIVKYEKNNFFILRNDKISHTSQDYHFVEKKDMSSSRANFKKIKGAEMWADLRIRYKNKKHDDKDLSKDEESYKKSYQLFHEAVNETLKAFHIPLE